MAFEYFFAFHIVFEMFKLGKKKKKKKMMQIFLNAKQMPLVDVNIIL